MDVARQLIAVALVLAALLLARRLIQRNGAWTPFRRNAGARPGPLEPQARLALGPQHSVHIVKARDRELILGVHPAGITLLGELRNGVQTPERGAE